MIYPSLVPHKNHSKSKDSFKLIIGGNMKRKILLLISLALLVLSCASAPIVPPPKFDVVVNSEKSSGLVDITTLVNWRNGDFFSVEGITGFDISITNKSDKVVRVVWGKSSLSYLGNSYTPFIDGQKYINASEPMSPAVIPAKGQITKSVFSSGQPYYVSGKYGGWNMGSIPSRDVTIVLCVESGSIEDYYTISIKAN